MFFVSHGPWQIATSFFLILNYQFGFSFLMPIHLMAGDGEPWEQTCSGASHESEDDS